MNHLKTLAASFHLCLALYFASGCESGTQPTITVYTSLDQAFSEPLFDEFTKETGIVVVAKFDGESQKTVGLTQAILAERNRPRCDLFWNNEVLNTVRLHEAGLLRVFKSDKFDDFPVGTHGTRGAWHAFAARARVLIINTDRLPNSTDWPQHVEELASPNWKGQCGMARPLAGTTATHATVLFHLWGEDRATEFFQNVHDNAEILSGNKRVAIAVAEGALSWGITDTDDALIELKRGMPVAIVFPNQKPLAGENKALGSLRIPNTLALISSSPHQQEAQMLVDFLLRRRTEEQLSEGPSGQLPLRKDLADWETQFPHLTQVTFADIDYIAVEKIWNTTYETLRTMYADR